jgi:chemotaxis protein CheC
MTKAHHYGEADIDRVRELVSIGAGHAASALASLTGRTCEMQVPSVRTLDAGQADSALAHEPGMTGVLFELEGGTGGVLALLFPAESCERLLEHLIGPGRDPGRDELARSALCELGNILASHAADAVAETLGVSVLPSLPTFARGDAPAALADLLATHHPTRPGLRIQTEISDRARELRGILVLVPDTLARVAPAGGF